MSAGCKNVIAVVCVVVLWESHVRIAAAGPLVADSVVDFSDAQGSNNWTYGFYDEI
jgi:hypothetical protein